MKREEDENNKKELNEVFKKEELKKEDNENKNETNGVIKQYDRKNEEKTLEIEEDVNNKISESEQVFNSDSESKETIKHEEEKSDQENGKISDKIKDPPIIEKHKLEDEKIQNNINGFLTPNQTEKNVKKLKKNEEEATNLCKDFDKSTTKANIFQKPGLEKLKKTSNFLETNLIKENEIKNPKQEFDEGIPSVLYYFQDEEWILIGKGFIILKNEHFIFVRDFMKITMINCLLKNINFEEQEDSYAFKALGRRSTPEGFEIVEMEYKISFENEKSRILFIEKVLK